VKEKNIEPSKLLFRRLQNLYVKTLYINYLFVTACIAVLFNDVCFYTIECRFMLKKNNQFNFETLLFAQLSHLCIFSLSRNLVARIERNPFEM